MAELQAEYDDLGLWLVSNQSKIPTSVYKAVFVRRVDIANEIRIMKEMSEFFEIPK